MNQHENILCLAAILLLICVKSHACRGGLFEQISIWNVIDMPVRAGSSEFIATRSKPSGHRML